MISLAIIAKDEVEKVRSIRDKYGKFFDEICVAADEKIEEFEKIEGIKVFPYKWINDFSDKRNFLAEKVSSPFYFRLDTDDDISNPEIIPEIVEFMDKGSFDVYYVPYDYAKDELGNVIARHWRETIIRKRPDIFWKKPIHENIFTVDQEKAKYLRDDRLRIVHNIDKAHAVESYNRNLQYLLEEFKRDGKDTDPRTIAYLGRMMMAKGKFREAIVLLENLISRSGWDDDKYFAWIQIAQCNFLLGRVDTAIASCNEALAINTQFPDAYIQLGIIYIHKQDYVKAVDWIMSGIARKVPDTVMVVDPTFYGYKAKLQAAIALLGKGDIELAWEFFNKAKAECPNDKEVLSREELFKDAYYADQYFKKLYWIIKFTRDNDKSLLPQIAKAIPKKMFADERVWQIYNELVEPHVWGEKEIAIFCGQAWEDWADPSVIKGIGGSEEAVIYLSRELTKLGYKVTVFNSCGGLEGEYNGVIYKPFYAFNPKDKYNILVAWRRNIFKGLTAKKKYVWLHDVPMPEQFTETDFDKVIVLSQYHKSLLPENIPSNKIYVSSNGINLPDFIEPTANTRNPKRIIYTSSYDRGIEHLLGLWGEVLKEVPDAELHLFYGWDTYDRMVKQGARDQRYKDFMVKLMSQKNVFEHGRVGHKQLIKELYKSGIYAYPSHFEEISCISAMKAQACGCIPVVTDYAALSETVKHGWKVGGKMGEETTNKSFVETLVYTLKNFDLLEGTREKVLSHKEKFGWDSVAKKWDEDLFR